MKHKLVFFIFVVSLLFGTNACSPYGGIQSTIPSLSYTLPPTQTPVPPSLTIPPPVPSETAPAPTSTLAATFTPLPTCNIVNSEGNFFVLGNDVFFFTGPDKGELDQALVEHYPEWANYEQNVRWDSEPATMGEIVSNASFQEQFALNPAVTLVTLGVSLDWKIPPNSDLFLQSLSIGERLVHLWDEYSHPDNEAIRARYPEIANGATYALYVFFDYDKEKLHVWCDTYQNLFGISPFQR